MEILLLSPSGTTQHKFILLKGGQLEVFDFNIEHQEQTNGRHCLAAGVVPPKGVLAHFFVGNHLDGVLSGSRWRSSTLNLETPKELRGEIFDLLVAEHQSIYD